MTGPSRRNFLKLAGGAAALNAMPGSIRRALAIGADRRTGTIQDVEHIVVFMQENRSFDHYFGHLRGVRGYNDRFPIPLPNGAPVWHQPSQRDALSPVLPFHFDTRTTSAQCLGDLDHSWTKTHAAQNRGRNDRWPANKTDMTMGYYQRGDIPFHYALADAFTVCDQYFCSIPTQTRPNRTYLMSGTNDPSGKFGGPVLDNHDYVGHDLPPQYELLSWTTYPERLQAAGVSWQVYQQGLTGRDPINGNYGTNVLMNFKQYIEAPPGSPLYERAMTKRSLATLKNDVLADRLPQVSWLLPPAAFSEHPQYTPAYGAQYMARVLDALTANPKVWSRTVLLIMYDENDGFFDHIMAPQPAAGPGRGLSTMPVEDELHRVVNPGRGGHFKADGLPYGLGPRVPMMAISPWSKGGFVCSQVFDHTSVIRFIEARFGVAEPNISAWRRAVCGDLTSAFDFARSDSSLPGLPDTSGYGALADFQCANQPPPQVPWSQLPAASTPLPPSPSPSQQPRSPQTPSSQVPAPQSVDAQEPGVRLARAIPYTLHVHGRADAGKRKFEFIFENKGEQGAHFYVYSRRGEFGPWAYTVGAGRTLIDALALRDEQGAYAFSVYGPNGFFRQFDGQIDGAHEVSEMAGIEDKTGKQTIAHNGAHCELRAEYDLARDGLVLHIANHGGQAAALSLIDNAYGAPSQHVNVAPHGSLPVQWPLAPRHYWYDVSLTRDGDTSFLRRLAGHVENGRPSVSDPAATEVVTAFARSG